MDGGGRIGGRGIEDDVGQKLRGGRRRGHRGDGEGGVDKAISRNLADPDRGPYVPNRKQATATPESSKKPSGRHQRLIEALASLRLTATAAQGGGGAGKIVRVRGGVGGA